MPTRTYTDDDRARAVAAQIVKGRDGSRAIRLSRTAFVPAEIASLAAGPDRWMQLVQFPCGECGAMLPAVDLYSGDLPGCCPACADDYFCPHGAHPDDDCDECEADRAAASGEG